MPSPILLYGATGLTGQLVAGVLERAGLSFTVAGRDGPRLRALSNSLVSAPEVRVAHVHDRDSLVTAMTGTAVVVNCAGPFRRLGEPVLDAAIRAGAHYLDTCGEQAFIRDMYQRYESAARKAKRTVVNGLAFEIALGDWAAALAAAQVDGIGPLDEIALYYALEGFHGTAGTQLSILSALSDEGVMWSDDRWEAVAPASETRSHPFPSPFARREVISFPSGEIITVPRHVDTRRVQSYISFAEDSHATRLVNRAGSFLGPALPLLANSPLGAFMKSRLSDPDHRVSTAQRRATTFCVVARAERSFERRQVSVLGADLYAATAAIIGYGCARLLDKGADAIGIVAPSEAFAPGPALEAVANACDLRVEKS